MNKLKFGVVGISDGNGHPYSWSAIFNGYDASLMKECPFQGIPNYLSKQQFPKDGLGHLGSVTHIWTQDKKISQQIAGASKIEHVADNIEDMIGVVDAILLARDDAENHLNFSLPFIEAGIPVYIDKPIAYTVTDAETIFSKQQYDWQVFSCSALRFAKEFQLSKTDIEELGKIVYAEACVPKNWKKYAIHVIEPLLQMLKITTADDIESYKAFRTAEINKLVFTTNREILVSITSFGKCYSDLSITFKGDRAEKTYVFNDSFFAFKAALNLFVETIRQKKILIPRQDTLTAIKIIEMGLQ